jgi:HD-GYP domain-containing protein (c-di-GMP phosphodiesterase class II)
MEGKGARVSTDRDDSASRSLSNELGALFQVSEAISSAVGRDELLNMILRMALIQTGATCGSILLKDDTGRFLKIVAAIGLDEDIVRSVRVRVGEGIAGRVAESGLAVVVGDIDEHPEFSKLARNYRDKSFMSVPLECDESVLAVPVKALQKVIGVLNVHRKGTGETFTERDFRLLCILANQAAVAIENARLLDDLENTYMNAFGSMALLLEAKDPYTQGHTERVTALCHELGQALGLGQHDLHNLRMGARLHDIGKIGINESILNKSGPLDEKEWLIVRQHPVVADRVVAPIMFLQEVRPVIRGHHERIDGKGYPDGLVGKRLSLGQKIIIVADAYDAMSSSRSYRAALADERITEELNDNTGSQFDADVVDALLDVLNMKSSSAFA